MSRHRATVYLVLSARRSAWGSPNPETGLTRIDTVRVARMRAERPNSLDLDEVAVKVTIDIPDSAFLPLAPTAEVVIPEDLTMRGPILVEAEDANDGE